MQTIVSLIISLGILFILMFYLNLFKLIVGDLTTRGKRIRHFLVDWKITKGEFYIYLEVGTTKTLLLWLESEL